MFQRAYKAIICNPLFVYKVISTFVQLYLLSMLSTNGSSQEPFIELGTVAHIGALAAALRGIDALIDPMFRKLIAPLTDEEKKQIAKDTYTASLNP